MRATDSIEQQLIEMAKARDRMAPYEPSRQVLSAFLQGVAIGRAIGRNEQQTRTDP
jgi:hypothetical protein